MHFDQCMNRMGRSGDGRQRPKFEVSGFKPSYLPTSGGWGRKVPSFQMPVSWTAPGGGTRAYSLVGCGPRALTRRNW